MKLLTVSNLYPRPDQPTRGMFNAQLFHEMAGILNARDDPSSRLSNVCLVPEWRLWRWPAIRRWVDPTDANHETCYLPVFYIPVFGRNWTAAFYRNGLARMRARIREYDVLYASWLHPDGTALVQIAREVRKPAWLMVLGTDLSHLRSQSRRQAILRAATECRGLICVCEPLADQLAQAGIAREKIHVVPNGVDSTRFHYRERDLARRELLSAARAAGLGVTEKFLCGLDSSDKIILFVGNLVDVKAPGNLIRAFAGLSGGAAGNTGVHLAVIGSGVMRRRLEALASELNLEDRIHFLGNVPHLLMPLWMNAADCLGLSSRREGMPNVVLEALASGLPLVCTNVGACEEMTSAEPGARVVSVDDAAAMSRALTELLGIDIDRKELAGRHGDYTWRHQAERILAIIEP